MSYIVNEVKSDVSASYVKMLSSYGMNPTLMKVYMSLFFSTKPMSLNEISNDSGYSKSTVLKTLEILENFTDLRRFKTPGSKKVYYECLHDVKVVQLKKIRQIRIQIIDLQKALVAGEERLKDSKDEDAKQVYIYVSTLRTDIEKFQTVLNGLEKLMGIMGKTGEPI